MISNINSKLKSKKEKNENKKKEDLFKLNIKKNIKEKIEQNHSKNSENKIIIPDYLKVNEIKEGRIKSYSYYSLAGKNIEGFQKINQDSYLILPNINNHKDFNIFCIFDGHGQEGQFISSFVSKYFSNFFKNDEKLNSKKNNKSLDNINYILQDNNFSFIKNLFKKAENELNKNNKIDSNFSGTTCTLLIQIADRIICANVGDSKAIMIKSYERIIEISKDHKPYLPEESNRILKNGGEIYQTEEYNDKIGPYRIWQKGEKYPGIDISRSIGDLIATRLGVISTPDVVEKYIDNGIKFIVIMTKGVCEYLSSKEIMDIVFPFYQKKDAKGACQTIINIASKLWNEEDIVVDDLTAIVIFF